MNLLVTIPYCTHDADAALRLINWITELGRCEGYSVLLIADDRTPVEMRSAIFHAAEKAFTTVYRKLAHVDSIYPQAANDMFATASRTVFEEFKIPFLWLEPDSVPLTKTWLKELAQEYYWAAKPFVGPLVRTEPPQELFTHLNGVSMYPQDTFIRLSSLDAFRGPVAWDMASADYSVPRTHETKLISQFWGTKEVVPTFVDRKVVPEEDPVGTLNTKIIHEDAVLFHRCKDGSLIDVCRKRIAAKKPTVEPGNVGYRAPNRTPAPVISESIPEPVPV